MIVLNLKLYNILLLFIKIVYDYYGNIIYYTEIFKVDIFIPFYIL
jgi:hypothetical protein